MKASRGFTLMELLFAIVALIVMMVVAVPTYRSFQLEKKRIHAQADLRVLKASVELYKFKTGKYPVAVTLQGKKDDPAWQLTLLNGSPRIIETVLMDPFSPGGAEPYHFVLSSYNEGEAKYYVIWSVGMNHKSKITGIDNASGALTGPQGDDLIETNTP